jgi:hypothetical protein
VNQPAPKNNPFGPIFFFFASSLTALGLFHACPARALEATTSENSSVPCAILENFGGDVEVLDPSRTRVVGLAKSSGIPCGGWISSGNGWAIVRHRDGHDLRIGPNTFLEIPESHPGATDSAFADQVVLYRGEMFGSTEGGGGELRVITANGRVRMKQGTMLINFNPESQDTQLVALDRPASLENRFEPAKKVVAKAGESTDLNFREMRVIPSYPKAISIASLHGKLALFKLTDQDQTKIYETAQARAERRLAAELVQAEPDEKVTSNRQIASEPVSATPAVASKRYNYDRNPIDPEQAQKLKAQWSKKMTAGEDIGEQILFPDRFYGKPQKVKVTIMDPAEPMNAQKQQTEDVEKKRLIQELSQIQE